MWDRLPQTSQKDLNEHTRSWWFMLRWVSVSSHLTESICSSLSWTRNNLLLCASDSGCSRRQKSQTQCTEGRPPHLWLIFSLWFRLTALYCGKMSLPNASELHAGTVGYSFASTNQIRCLKRFPPHNSPDVESSASSEHCLKSCTSDWPALGEWR